jgi:hypothetical protein
LSFFYYLNTNNLYHYLKLHLSKPFTSKESLGKLSLDKIIPSINKELDNPFLVSDTNSSCVILDKYGNQYLFFGLGDKIASNEFDDPENIRLNLDKLSNPDYIDTMLSPLYDFIIDFNKKCLVPLKLLNENFIINKYKNKLQDDSKDNIQDDSKDNSQDKYVTEKVSNSFVLIYDEEPLD